MKFLIESEEIQEDFKKSKLSQDKSLYAINVKYLYEECFENLDYNGCLEIFKKYNIKYVYNKKLEKFLLDLIEPATIDFCWIDTNKAKPSDVVYLIITRNSRWVI